MGGRDYRWRESKKRKKGARKPAAPVSPLPLPEVEVVPKGKKSAREREE